MKQQPSEEDEERREWREKMDKEDLPPSDERLTALASAILARQWSVQTCGSSAPPPLVPGRAAVLDVHVLGSAAGPPMGSSALCRSSAFGFREGLGEGESLGLLADQ